MIITAVYPTKLGATVYFRFEMPLRYLNGFKVEKVYLPSREDKGQFDTIESFLKLINGDIVILHRSLYANSVLAKALKERGKKIIWDTDDLEYQLPNDHPLKANYPKEEIKRFIINTSKYCDEIWVTTNYLAKEIKKLVNKPVIVVRNSIDLKEPQWFAPVENNKEIKKIGWVGGVSHLPDLPVCAEGLNLLYKEGYDFIFKLCGIPKIQKELVQSEKIGPILKPMDEKREYKFLVSKIFSKIPESKIRYFEVLPLEEYALFYTDMDIVIAPLVVNAFNHAKSELKILEAGAKGLPIVCSPTDSYLEFNYKYPGTINIATYSKDWYRILKRLLEDDELRIEQGKKLREVVNKHYNLKSWSNFRNERLVRLLNEN